MPVMTRICRITPVVMLCALFPLPLCAQAVWRFADISFPSTLDDFVSLGTRRWIDNPELGAMLEYTLRGDRRVDLTIYVYPVRNTDTLAVRGEASAERDVSLEELRAYAEQPGAWELIRVDSIGPIVIDKDSQTFNGAYAALLLGEDDLRLESLLYVFVRGNNYFKFRLTYLTDDRDAVEPRLLSLLARALTEIGSEPKQDPETAGRPAHGSFELASNPGTGVVRQP